MEKIQFVETSRTQRRFGVSVEHNTAEIARFCGVPVSFPTIPTAGIAAGTVVAEIPTQCGFVIAQVGDWLVKDSEGHVSVAAGEAIK